ncbi:RNA 2',3'-cyclic phosphodiesterase [Lottiidibacillus patelloidae]|uniref:RNA 2',3'-cyclic phosphodiesterase n=1 Tax=Lottiidibacillus patelloidae TaxID=2670334 RepID=A0A263BQX3_9BACI|nr:RNA 2',3'-cyclic phosphodiesterase [Lottiidibacillus patelloidae]OZM56100.1 RNA 2',3'-cyclic phosphodiesterase [Lottiidibacillus patelloidae]
MNRHYFIAIPIPQEIKEQINECRLTNAEHLFFKKWVHFEDYHITLVFLGHANEFQLKKINEEMAGVHKQFSPFHLTISHFGTFGNEQKPRVFWAGINESKLLMELQKSIYDRCTNVGFSLETRPYSPHLTLARKWNGIDEYNQSNFQLKEEVTFEVNSFSLFETHMERSPKYKTLYNWTFNL